MKKILATIISAAIMQSSFACTAVNIQANDGTVVAGRTMEWAYDNMQWALAYYPAGSTYYLTAPDNTKLPKVKMASKYAVLGIGTKLATDALLEGQNSAGLGVSGNFLPGFSKYQQVNKEDKHYVSSVEFLHFILSNFASVAEVKTEIQKYKVWLPTIPGSPEKATLHFIITDKTNAAIVVEFINGQMKVFDKTVGVLTNSPAYDWHMTNIRNYVNLSNEAVTQRTTTTMGDITNVSQGGGGLGLPGDYMSPSRFVKATFLKYYSDKPANKQDAISLTTHILDTVDIPKGVVSSLASDGKIYSDYTQWVAIKDLNSNVLYFSDYNHRGSYVKIDLNKLMLKQKPFNLQIEQIQYNINDISDNLTK